MKILHIINSFMRGGGAETLVLTLATALSRIEGNTVHVLSLKDPEDKEFVQFLEEQGGKCFALSENLKSFKNVQLLANFIKRGNYDIVNVHLFPSLYVAALAKILKGVNTRLVYTEHSTTNRRRGRLMFRIIDKRVYHVYDCIITISKEVELALKKHVPDARTVTINNGINISLFENAIPANIRTEMGLKPDCKLVTMVARFCFMKDYKTLIKAMSRLERDIHLLCIGDGPFLNENKEYAKAVGVDSRIHFLGLRKDVPNLLQASDVIVLSSKHEGFSISMLEAMSCKKPFIGSNVPGIGDLVRDVALLFEFQDDEELALRIKEVLTDRTLDCNVAEKCYSFAKQYDINIISQKYMKLYRSL